MHAHLTVTYNYHTNTNNISNTNNQTNQQHSSITECRPQHACQEARLCRATRLIDCPTDPLICLLFLLLLEAARRELLEGGAGRVAEALLHLPQHHVHGHAVLSVVNLSCQNILAGIPNPSNLPTQIVDSETSGWRFRPN